METRHVSPERVVYFINTPGHRPQHFVQCFTKELRYHFDLSVNAPICHSVCNTHTHTVFGTTVLTLAEHKRLFRLGDFIFYLLTSVPLCFQHATCSTANGIRISVTNRSLTVSQPETPLAFSNTICSKAMPCSVFSFLFSKELKKCSTSVSVQM